MSAISFQTFDELSQAFPDLKSRKKLHTITEKRLALLLEDIYPDDYAITEPGEIPGGRSDLAFYFGSGRYAVFEVFATVSQVAQDLRHLEQSNAQARIAILTDRALDDGRIFEEYFRKRPRDPFPWVKLSDILVVENEANIKEQLKQYIDEAFASDRLVSEPAAHIDKRLEALGLGDENDENFGRSRFTANVAPSDSRYVILAAIPLNTVVCSATDVLNTAKDMLQVRNWHSRSGADLPPKCWPPSIFDIPDTRRSAQNALFWENTSFEPNTNRVLSRLVITGSAEVIFASGTMMFLSPLENGTRVFRLAPILAKCWKLSGLVAQLYKDIGYIGKTHLCIGMVKTMNSHLGGFSDYWPEPGQAEYWHKAELCRRDWSCHSPNLRRCKTVDLMSMKPKTQPEFIKQFAEAISLAYNHDTPRCFDKKTGLIPERYFKSVWFSGGLLDPSTLPTYI
jgi:hypothetical protein